MSNNHSAEFIQFVKEEIDNNWFIENEPTLLRKYTNFVFEKLSHDKLKWESVGSTDGVETWLLGDWDHFEGVVNSGRSVGRIMLAFFKLEAGHTLEEGMNNDGAMYNVWHCL